MGSRIRLRQWFQRLENISRCEQLGCYAELVHDPRTEAEETHLHAFEIVKRFNLLAEPTGSFGWSDTTRNRFDIVLAEHFIGQFQTATVVHPAKEFRRFRAKWHRRKKVERHVSAGEESRGRSRGIDGTF